MNNSLPRLIDGMIATLRREVIPNLEGEFARGQAIGIIYMLNSIQRRASWSNRFFHEQLLAFSKASKELQAMAGQLPGAPLPGVTEVPDLPDEGALEARRNASDEQLCRMIDWLAERRENLPATVVAEVETILDDYLNRQLKWDIETSAKPMFTEISRGRED
ncbi:hypothetical protein [Bradyrhizobium sp.]|uniref:hypothetical protein n=1 Tax=Bradyrhizobium sp. TaxID=376 RepID=UPI0039E52483